MKKRRMYFIVLAFVAAIMAAIGYFVATHGVTMFQPKGTIGLQERNLMIVAALLMLVVVIPVFALTFVFAWKYRDDNKKTKYTPEWDHDLRFELGWWAFPIIIIAILSVITWRSSHTLSPYRAIKGSVPPVHVEVVALDWKWLFIYPQQHIATVNVLRIPVNTPIAFQVTSDAPMNSFWIPALGGQIYAMPGMSTQLHLMASASGTYPGLSANLSGNGFAGMDFKAEVTSRAVFNAWVQGIQHGGTGGGTANATGTPRGALTVTAYKSLRAPSRHNTPSYYSSIDPALYNWIVMKYMKPNATATPPAEGTSSAIGAGTMAIPRQVSTQ